MSGSARVYIDGNPLEIMGNVTNNFLAYTNTAEASRSGRIYVSTEPKARSLSIDDIKVDINEYPAFKAIFAGCGGRRITVTVVYNEDCPADLQDGYIEHHYTGCFITGEPEFSAFERKITGFEIAYENEITRNGI